MASKMYILVRDSIDIGHAMTACAHASLSGYLTFISVCYGPEATLDQIAAMHKVADQTLDWSAKSFRKVVCKVTDAEFEEAKTYQGLAHRIMTESGLGGAETAIVFAPRYEFPEFFKKLQLYK